MLDFVIRPLLRLLAPCAAALSLCASPAAIAEEAAAPPSPRERVSATPALWRVSDNDSVVWLFGSFHILPPQLSWRTPELAAAFSRSETVYFELPIGPETDAEVGRLSMTLGFAPRDRAAGVVLNGRDWARLVEAAARYNIPESAVQPMRPWFVSVLLSLQAIVAEGFDPESGVEKVIAAEAVAADKTLAAFETPAQQLGFFDQLDPQTERNLLISTLDDLEEGPAAFAALFNAWADGDAAAIDREINGRLRGDIPRLYEVLITERNTAWAEELEEVLAGAGETLVVVGAGHLVGADGVPTMLESRGFTVVQTTPQLAP